MIWNLDGSRKEDGDILDRKDRVCNGILNLLIHGERQNLGWRFGLEFDMDMVI